MRTILFICLTVFLGSCSDPTIAPIYPNATHIGTAQNVLVVTNRARTESGFLGGERSETTEYLDITVSVPPNRELGKVPVSYRNSRADKHFVLANSQNLSNRKAFQQTMRRQLAAFPTGERDITIFVHGYNNSFSDGVFRTAQLVNDFELNGLALHYSWPSIAHPLGYTHDRDSLLFARDGLEEMLRDTFASGAENIVLVAHSLGSMLVMEALRQMDIASPGVAERALDGVILIAPDIDLDLFRSQTNRIAALPQPFAIFVSQKDYALRLSSRINGRSMRLGTLAEATELANLPVVLLDVTAFSDKATESHFTAASSPALISLLSRSAELNVTFSQSSTANRGGLPGAVVTVRNATQLILSPGILR